MLVATEAELASVKTLAPHSFVDVPGPDGKPAPLVTICRAATGEDERIKNVQINIQRFIPRFLWRPDLQMLRNEPIALVGGGPSLAAHLDEIRKFTWVMAAGSSHDYLIENGIIPTFAVSTDPKEETNKYFKHLRKEVQYLIASTCAPSMMDRLTHYPTWLWHFREQVGEEHYRGETSICWGCMIGVVSIHMALWLGFQHQHYYGYDCSVTERSHAYDVSERECREILESATDATVGNRTYRTTTALICKMQHFFGVYASQDNRYLKGYVHGDGLLRETIRQSPPEMAEWLEAA